VTGWPGDLVGSSPDSSRAGDLPRRGDPGTGDEVIELLEATSECVNVLVSVDVWWRAIVPLTRSFRVYADGRVTV